MTKMVAQCAADAREDDDAALVAAIASGDRGAMADLYDRYAPFLFALAMRVLRNRAVAEDVLHDALLEAWRRAGEYDARRGSVRSWLVTRVRSRALDAQVSSVRRARLLKEHSDLFASSCYQRPECAPSDDERVRQEVAVLPAELGVVIDLVYYEGLSAGAAGARLRIPSGTVKSRLARAKSLLREQLRTGTDALLSR